MPRITVSDLVYHRFKHYTTPGYTFTNTDIKNPDGTRTFYVEPEVHTRLLILQADMPPKSLNQVITNLMNDYDNRKEF